MKRLSKTAWIVLGIGIFVIAFIALYMLYYQQGREQDRLDNELLLAQTTTARVASEKRDMESQLTRLQGELAQLNSELTQAESQLNSSQRDFPNSVESIEYSEKLFYIAHGWGLEITRLTSSEPSGEDVEDITFSVTSFMVNVKGQVDDILGFVNTIIMDSSFVNGTVETVNVQVPEPLTEGEKEGLTAKEIEEKENASATITLNIYGY